MLSCVLRPLVILKKKRVASYWVYMRIVNVGVGTFERAFAFFLRCIFCAFQYPVPGCQIL